MKESNTKTKSDLLKRLEEIKLSLKDLRFGVAGGKNKDVHKQSKSKKEIARILTKLNEK